MSKYSIVNVVNKIHPLSVGLGFVIGMGVMHFTNNCVFGWAKNICRGWRSAENSKKSDQ